MTFKKKVLAGALALFFAMPGYADFDAGAEAFKSGNHALAYQELKSAAEEGDGRAQVLLGIIYQGSRGVDQDYSRAYYWLEKAALQDFPIAQYFLAEQLYKGFGVERDLKQAARWYKKAAAQDHMEAQFYTGYFYANGLGVTQDYKQAIYWYEKAANQGLVTAKLNLGIMYGNVNDVKDYKKAAFWLEEAAKQDHSLAQYFIGHFYDIGQGVPQSYKAAAYWYEQAAEQGHTGAQYSLASLYENGHGVIQDYIQAHKWMNIASANGHERAREARDQVIAPKMTPQQIQQAQALARAFLSGEVAPEPKAPQPAAPSVTTGSGFVIGKNGQIVTNAHVVEGCKSISVELGNQQTSATLQAADNTNDMAILKSSLTTTRPANLAAGQITLGQTAYAMGFPLRGLLGQDLQMTNGIISGLNGLQNDFRYYQINAAVQSGNSGGPLLNEQANVIGIVSMKLNAVFVNELVGDLPQNVNFAIKSTQLMGYLDANSVDYQVTSSGQKLSSSQVAERAREFTVFITCEK
ncbi:MAG: trypsin-like peptidase domain-containing protein [Thiomicrospira sp.]